MSDHLTHWNAMARPPKSALKEIKGGRLQGMTDVNPQWRYQAMTEQFGPCGVGWRYTIDKIWTEPGADGEVMAFAQVSVFMRADNVRLVPTGFKDVPPVEVVNTAWSEPIVGIGGNHLITKEKNGLRSNDECWKMAVTDALSVALKMLGVAADVYAGRWDGSKYVDPSAEKAEDRATVTPDKATKKARVMPPEAKEEGAVFIEKVIPKTSGNREWAEIVLSSGASIIARDHGAITLAVNLVQEASPVIVTTHRNGKGNEELDELARWSPGLMRPTVAEQPTGAF